MTFYDKDLIQLPEYDKIDWGPGWGNFGEQAKNSQLVYYFKNTFFDKDVCICNNKEFNPTIINNSNVDLVLFNLSDHPYENDDNMIAWNRNLSQITKPYIELKSNFKNTDYYPYHLFYSAYHAKFDTVDFDSTRQYTISYINRSTRFTRIYLLLKLLEKSYDDIKINWFKLSDSNQPIPDSTVLAEQIGKNLADEFFDIEHTFPDYLPKSEYQLCSDISDFTSSYLNIVTEARCDDIGYLTEKTYKPIRAGQLFLMQGPPGTVSYLRSIGFDTFDDLLDHDKYDHEPNWQKRTDLMLSVLDRAYSHIEDYFLSTASRRLKNKEWLCNNAGISQ
jgi:glutaredoxin